MVPALPDSWRMKPRGIWSPAVVCVSVASVVAGCVRAWWEGKGIIPGES